MNKHEKRIKTMRDKREAFIASPIFTLDETVNLLLNGNITQFNQYELSKFLKSNIGLKESIYWHSKGNKDVIKVAYLIYKHDCKECGCDTGFISLDNGFKEYCNDHKSIKCSKIRKDNNLIQARKVINDHNFEILNEPIGINDGTFHVKCTKNHEFELWLRNGRLYKDLTKSCPQCYISTISKPEYEIKDWLESNGIEVIQQHKISKYKNGVKTIDLYLPKFNIGIEFDGIKWHSFGKSDHSMFNNYLEEDKNIHLNKTKICEDLGIQLLHIFSNEWEEKQDIWKSVILTKCNISDKIYARKCKILSITDKDYKNFVENNHLQGYAKASTKLGLIFENELVAIASFSTNRFSGKGDFELIRFASRLNFTIIGGFSRLMKRFRTEHTGSIVSYANKRWSIGNVYKKNGFELLNESSPNYWYLDEKMNFHSRLEFQRHKLNDLSDRSESEIMFDRGYRRIWDCGNLVYKYN